MSDQVAVALAYSLPPTIATILIGGLNFWQARRIRHAMNSILDQRVADAKAIGHAEGRKKEREGK